MLGSSPRPAKIIGFVKEVKYKTFRTGVSWQLHLHKFVHFKCSSLHWHFINLRRTADTLAMVIQIVSMHRSLLSLMRIV